MYARPTDKAASRAAKMLRRAISAEAHATTERATKRHQRRAREARKALFSLDYDARRFGADLADA